MGGAPISILVADRNELVATALKDMFIELSGETVLIATSLSEALAVARRDRPQLVLVDAAIGKQDAEEAVRRLLECSPASAVYVMASDVDPDFEHRVLQAGAMGCSWKESLPAAAQGIVDGVRARQ